MNAVGANEIRSAAPSELEAIFGAGKGFVGPKGLEQFSIPEEYDGKKITLVADLTAQEMKNFVIGANETDKHFVGVNWSDLEAPIFADIRLVEAGEKCPDCGEPLFVTKGIEVGNIFQLGTKYSKAMNAVYLDENGKRENYYRIVTSNNKCEPVEQSLPNVNQNATRYRFNEGSNLTFITVSPSVAPSFKPNATPYIGKVGQQILFVNTKFEPILLDIEMVDKDVENIATMLEGSQLRSLDNGLVTTFNENNEIYHQSEHYSLKDPYTGEPVYEVKMNKTDSIDFSQTIEDK
jgi:hypothetical protein